MDLYRLINETGAILPEPPIPSERRWKSSKVDTYPFVRHIGGVSLFDFREFDVDSFERQCVMCNWYDFVPYLEGVGNAVWIEIDPRHPSIRERFLSPSALWRRQDEEGAHRHTLMPRIEACVLGEIPFTAFLSTITYKADG